MAGKARTGKTTGTVDTYEVPWDGQDLSEVIVGVQEPAVSYTEATASDLLRHRIAAERPGAWLQLRTYKPMPKRAALSVAASWRKANPDTFGGNGIKFEARIAPVNNQGIAASAPLVTKETLYAVVVRYPATPEETPSPFEPEARTTEDHQGAGNQFFEPENFNDLETGTKPATTGWGQQ